MGVNSVIIHFSTEDNAQSLASCLEQMLRNLKPDVREEE